MAASITVFNNLKSDFQLMWKEIIQAILTLSALILEETPSPN